MNPRFTRRAAWLGLVAASLAVAGLTALIVARADDEADLVGFQQILPRGRIASIDAPKFVSASKAAIGADAWVLGVEIEGQPRAFSLALLNRHEVVNDRVGKTPYAAVW